ncbi:hypothetical protein ACKWTF_001264 [Chironomus riparius]
MQEQRQRQENQIKQFSMFPFWLNLYKIEFDSSVILCKLLFCVSQHLIELSLSVVAIKLHAIISRQSFIENYLNICRSKIYAAIINNHFQFPVLFTDSSLKLLST